MVFLQDRVIDLPLLVSSHLCPSQNTINPKILSILRLRRSLFRWRFNIKFNFKQLIFSKRLTMISRITRRSGHAHNCGEAEITKCLLCYQLGRLTNGWGTLILCAKPLFLCSPVGWAGCALLGSLESMLIRIVGWRSCENLHMIDRVLGAISSIDRGYCSQLVPVVSSTLNGVGHVSTTVGRALSFRLQWSWADVRVFVPSWAQDSFYHEVVGKVNSS